VNPARSEKTRRMRAWLASFAAASGLTLAILLLLVFAHREPSSPLPAIDNTGIRVETIEIPEKSGSSALNAATPNLASLLPVSSPIPVSPLAVDAPAIDVSVDLSQMLNWRYSYADMGSSGAQAGSFGISNYADVDHGVENLVIPPKLFPDALIDAGITEGRVVVKLLIDEKGHAEVKYVLSSTHPSLVPIIVEAMNRSIYSIPIRDGRPTKSIINRTVVFSADPDHVAKRQALANP
jgi:hypothetical protein